MMSWGRQFGMKPRKTLNSDTSESATDKKCSRVGQQKEEVNKNREEAMPFSDCFSLFFDHCPSVARLNEFIQLIFRDFHEFDFLARIP